MLNILSEREYLVSTCKIGMETRDMNENIERNIFPSNLWAYKNLY